MNKKQYIAEHLDPMDTVATWNSGEEFADAILEIADGEIPVTRNDLIDYWKQARHTAEKARLEKLPLLVEVKYGPRDCRQTAIVTLNGFTMSDKLTPKLARAALRIVGATDGIVWTLPKPDPETGEILYWDVYGYRVNARSARKI